MKLSTKMRYGTRAMVCLGLAYPAKAVSVKELAQDQHLSEKYLEQIMAGLKAAGLVKVARGVYGGYTLTPDPSTVTLLNVYKALEGPLSLVDCVDAPGICEMSADCVTREVWSEMERSLKRVLEKTTIKDLVERKREKIRTEIPMFSI